MVEPESRKLAYLFKLRQSQGVRDKIAKLAQQKDWRSAGTGGKGSKDTCSWKVGHGRGAFWCCAGGCGRSW